MTRLPLTRTLKHLSAALLGTSLIAALGIAQAADSSIVIRGKDGWLLPGWGSLTEVDNRGIDASTALISEARKALAARNVQLQLLVLPDKTLFYQDKLPDGTTVSPQVQQRYQTILSRLAQAEVPTFDNAAVLRALKQSGHDVFYRTDQHWTQAGADATAVATAEQIKRLGPALKGSAGSGMALGSEFNERRFGDLAELFLTPDERKKIGRDTFTIRREASAASLLDDAPAPVHVTGHSMVQPYFGYPQKLSNALDRPVSVNWKPGNVGPWIVLLEYLESAEFQQHPPQVLVWQLFEPTFNQGPQAQGYWDNASIMSADSWRKRLQAAVGH